MNTEAHREIEVTGNMTFIAHFEMAVGIGDVEGYTVGISATGLRIVVEGAEHQDIRIYTVDGHCVHMLYDAAEREEIEMDAAGVYLVKVGDRPAQRVVIVR